MSAALEAYVAGEPLADICDRYAISERTLRNQRRRAGIPPRRGPAGEQRVRAALERDPGASSWRIAVDADVSESYVQQIRRRLALPARGRGQ